MARARMARRVALPIAALGLALALGACGAASGATTASSGTGAAPASAPTLTGAAAGQVIFEQSCASCHGVGGVGQTFTMDDQSIAVPAITYSELEALYHDKYDSMVVATITTGVDEEGQPLNRMMPRWTIFSSDQMDALVVYLKSLQ